MTFYNVKYKLPLDGEICVLLLGTKLMMVGYYSSGTWFSYKFEKPIGSKIIAWSRIEYNNERIISKLSDHQTQSR